MSRFSLHPVSLFLKFLLICTWKLGLHLRKTLVNWNKIWLHYFRRLKHLKHLGLIKTWTSIVFSLICNKYKLIGGKIWCLLQTATCIHHPDLHILPALLLYMKTKLLLNWLWTLALAVLILTRILNAVLVLVASWTFGSKWHFSRLVCFGQCNSILNLVRVEDIISLLMIPQKVFM